MAAKFKILGITDEVTACDCCGKSPLKSTTAVEIIDTGEILHYGSTCVTRNTCKTPKEIRTELADRKAEKISAARAEFRVHPAVIAAAVKVAEASRLGIEPGKKFSDFHRSEWTAAQAARREIAERHHISVWEVI